MSVVITGTDSRNRQHTGRFVAITLREWRFFYVRLDHLTRGPIVKLTPAEFAALGPIPTGHAGLHIGDTVTVTRFRGGQAFPTAGQIESVVYTGDDRQIKALVHEEGRTLALAVAVSIADRCTVTPA